MSHRITAINLSIPQRVRSLVLAASLALVAASVPTLQAHAEPNTGGGDPGVRCAAKIGPGQYEFYLPGEKATDVNGNKWVCGPDGQWFRDYSSALVHQTRFWGAASNTTMITR